MKKSIKTDQKEIVPDCARNYLNTIFSRINNL
jgi:hypothetical protein